MLNYIGHIGITSDGTTGGTTSGTTGGEMKNELVKATSLLDLSAATAATGGGVIVLLTRDEHVKGRWLLALERALVAKGAKVKILPLSSFEKVENNWRCLVNRCSDASAPAEVKRCMAALRSAQLRGVRTVNGIASFAIGTSKLMHHELFDRVGCKYPACVQVSHQTTPAEALEKASKHGISFPLLVKPNAGGFGAGIVSISSATELTVEVLESSLGADGLGVLQHYEKPVDGFIYRVFFLDGQVQCAVRVRANSLDGFNACVCSTKFVEWDCPHDVVENVKAMAAVAEADCGSVELMYVKGSNIPLYFDFNLLSTLPDDKSYEQLAEFVLRG
jgi:glutathione synthase/RimK-type ligase-like ATP-grasp enzyme